MSASDTGSSDDERSNYIFNGLITLLDTGTPEATIEEMLMESGADSDGAKKIVAELQKMRMTRDRPNPSLGRDNPKKAAGTRDKTKSENWWDDLTPAERIIFVARGPSHWLGMGAIYELDDALGDDALGKKVKIGCLIVGLMIVLSPLIYIAAFALGWVGGM